MWAGGKMARGMRVQGTSKSTCLLSNDHHLVIWWTDGTTDQILSYPLKLANQETCKVKLAKIAKLLKLVTQLVLTVTFVSKNWVNK